MNEMTQTMSFRQVVTEYLLGNYGLIIFDKHSDVFEFHAVLRCLLLEINFTFPSTWDIL